MFAIVWGYAECHIVGRQKAFTKTKWNDIIQCQNLNIVLFKKLD